jgi:hypothetical protein
MAQEGVEPALLIIDAEASGVASKWRLLRNLNRLLWYLYRLFFVRCFSRAERQVDLAEALKEIPSIRCTVIRKGKFSQYFRDADIAEIRRHDLDFILRFAFNIIRGEILKTPRFGVWSFHHGDEERYRGSPPAFWEIYKGDNVTGAILQRLTNKLDAGIVLKKGFVRTIDTSYIKNRDRVFFESAAWPVQVCIDIQNGNTGYVEAPPSKTSAPILYPPDNLQMLRFVLRILTNTLRLFRLVLFYDQWNIGIVASPIRAFLSSGFEPQVRWLPKPPRNRFFADPFAVHRGDTLHILFEDFDYQTSKGFISAVSVRGDSVCPHRAVITAPVHMAYPFLLEHEGRVYCIPESWEAREVQLYEERQFPQEWEKVSALKDDFAGVDSTVFRHEGRWWLLGTDEDDGSSHKLKSWYSDDLRGPWKAHAANPIKVDIRSARPAGTPFMCNGDLYRPAQDCSQRYGGRIVLTRVLRLTPTEFEEEWAAVIEPDKTGPYPDGIHTICAAGDVTVIDGVRKEFALKSLSVLMHKIRRIRSQLAHPKHST